MFYDEGLFQLGQEDQCVTCVHEKKRRCPLIIALVEKMVRFDAEDLQVQNCPMFEVYQHPFQLIDGGKNS